MTEDPALRWNINLESHRSMRVEIMMSVEGAAELREEIAACGCRRKAWVDLLHRVLGAGGCSLCIGAEGYNKESYVVICCTEEERRQFPIGTQFDLVCVEETRGVACPACGGSGCASELAPPFYVERACQTCKGTGRA